MQEDVINRQYETALVLPELYTCYQRLSFINISRSVYKDLLKRLKEGKQK